LYRIINFPFKAFPAARRPALLRVPVKVAVSGKIGIARQSDGDYDTDIHHHREEQMDTITWQDFTAVELRVGTVLTVKDFPRARNPAYIITADFGTEIGIRKTSAQVTALYGKDDLVGRQIVGVVNFPAKQVGPVRSEFLLTGFYAADREVVLAIPERPVPNGAKLL